MSDPSLPNTYENFYGQGTRILQPLIMGTDQISKDQILLGIDYLERALDIEPRSWPACWVLGKAYTVLGDLKRAHGLFCCAYQINPSDKNVCRELGLSFLRLGRPQNALSVFQKLVDHFPEDHTLVANLGLCQWMTGSSQLGLATVDRALRLNNSEISQALRRRIIATMARGAPAPTHLET